MPLFHVPGSGAGDPAYACTDQRAQTHKLTWLTTQPEALVREKDIALLTMPMADTLVLYWQHLGTICKW